MKLLFLGTAAAEGWPALFCECEGCRKARQRGGKDIRHRCSYIIDDDTMVDFGPDTYAQALACNIDLVDIRHMFITHSHVDHYTPKEFNWRSRGYSKVEHNLDLYANQHALDMLPNVLYKPLDELAPWKLTPHCVEPGDCIETDGLRVTALLADHAGPEQKPLNFVIERGGKAIFIGNDSGWWSDESWDILSRFKLDIAVLECTYGITWKEHSKKHMGADCTVAARDELQRRGILKPDATVVATHFSHNCQNLHEDFEAFFNPKGIIVAYDGMLLEK